MKRLIAIAGVLTLACLTGAGQTSQTPPAQSFPPEQIRAGAAIFDRHCSPCHGAHMADPEAAFDLRTFPPDQHARFVQSVTKGKNSMPPWADILKPEDIEALWAYVVAGEKPTDASKAATSKTQTDASQTDASDEAPKGDAPKNSKKDADKGKPADRSREKQ